MLLSLVIGSEEKSDASDEESNENKILKLLRVSRVARAMTLMAEDTPEEAQAAGIVVTPLVEAFEYNSDGVMHGPTALFDFDWQPYQSAPIAPHLRREQFVGRAGPMMGPISSPYEAFVLIWDRPIMEYIAEQTNIYAQEYAEELIKRGLMKPTSWKALWKDTDVDELYVFFCILFAMSATLKLCIEEYWMTDGSIWNTPNFPDIMSLKRFQILSRCLHFQPNKDFSRNSLTPSQAKLSKIMPIVEHLNAKFSSLYSLNQNIVLDDTLTQWKAWLDIARTHGTPNKAEAIGIKTYEVCDCRTGYLWRFDCHAVGGQAEVQQGLISGSIPDVVLRLLRGLEHRGHTVWMDEYYNSPALARVLKSIGYDCVGTIRTNRQFVPQQLTELKSDMRTGQVCGYTSGDVDLMIWRDQSFVAWLSTYHGITISEGKPIAVKDYNETMGSVDKKDKVLSMYPMERARAHGWYKNFFRRLLNASVLNAFILYKYTNEITYKKFRSDLQKQLLGKHFLTPTTSNAVGRRTELTQEYANHLPRVLSQPMMSGKLERLRRLCVLCKKKRTQYICPTCNVSLCTNFSDPNSSCFVQYHVT